MKFAAAIAAIALLIPAAALAFDVGPAIGSRAPALHVTDVGGKAQTVASLTGKKGVVVMFFRSAKWCPYCQAQLTEFRDAQAPLEARGYRLVAISYDPPEVLTRFEVERQIGYTLLSDAGSVTIDAWNLRDPQYPATSFAYGVPRPAIFVISPKGVIQAKLAEEGYKVRPSVAAVVAAIDALPH